MTNLKSAVKALKKIKSKPRTNLMMAMEALMNLKKKPIIEDNGFTIKYDEKNRSFYLMEAQYNLYKNYEK